MWALRSQLGTQTCDHVVSLPPTTWPPSRAPRRGLAIAFPIVRRTSETVPAGPQLERLVRLLWPFSESSGAPGTWARNPLLTLREPVPTSELSPDWLLRPFRGKDVWAGAAVWIVPTTTWSC